MALVNRYLRSYYANPGGRFRITIDTELAFYKVNPLVNRFLVKDINHHAVIVELKYEQEYEDLANQISSAFPFRLTRSSKYVEGIDRFLRYEP